MTRPTQSVNTAVVHAGEPEPRIGGSVVMPVFHSANYEHEEAADYHAIKYVRLSNSPNHEVLHRKLAALEHAQAALVTSSGMAAVSTALLSVLGAGDHLLAIDCPYGGTRNLLTDDLPRFGIETTFIDGEAPEQWPGQVRPNTRAIYFESITNPLMQVPDLRAAVDFAKAHDLVSMVDNTFTTPVNFRPVEIGFDLSLHSCTKYLNGHSDLAAGAVIGKSSLIEPIHRLANHLGGVLDPRTCYLLQRGIKTLALRVRQQNHSAMRIAAFLEDHASVAHVSYPGLESHAGHTRARDLFDGFGGMLSFELNGDVETALRFLEHMTIPIHAASLGSVESLICRPAVTAYANVSDQDKRRLGVSERLLRFSVGIEDTDELIEDLDRAIRRAT